MGDVSFLKFKGGFLRDVLVAFDFNFVASDQHLSISISFSSALWLLPMHDSLGVSALSSAWDPKIPIKPGDADTVWSEWHSEERPGIIPTVSDEAPTPTTPEARHALPTFASPSYSDAQRV